MELGNLRGNIIADLLIGVIEDYHLLAPMTRKMMKKDAVIKSLLDAFQVDESITLSTVEIYKNFIKTKTDLIEELIKSTIEDDVVEGLSIRDFLVSIDTIINGMKEGIEKFAFIF